MSESRLRFFMNVPHEIRTPMTLILSPLTKLMNGKDEAQYQELYEMIRRNAQRILHLINQMLDARKIEQARMQLHMSENDLIGFINDTYHLFSFEAENKNIALTTRWRN